MSCRPALRSLTLTLTDACQLRCAYCYTPKRTASTLDRELCDQAVDLFGHYADPAADLSLSFFGGEPFLAPSLMRQAVERARSRFAGRKLRVLTPTNAIALGTEALSMCEELGLDLAVSIDGDENARERVYPNGKPAFYDVLSRLPSLIRHSARHRVLARMTVTPANVHLLSSGVKMLTRLGFTQIVYLPAYELAWSNEAVSIWQREHMRLGTWLTGMRGAGASVPDLPGWRAVEGRLVRGRPRSWCGAGHKLAAVSTDGRLFPCYRFVYEPNDTWSLGRVEDGFSRTDVLSEFAALEPQEARPEHGSCAACEARDGCTFFCPALGALMLGDPRKVPAASCSLMRAQVLAIRNHLSGSARVRRPWAPAAAMAAALAAAGLSQGCGGQAEDSRAPVADAASDTQAEADGFDAAGGGVCPQQVDSALEDSASDGPIGPGICDPIDGGGGVCPVYEDAGEDSYGGGVCPQLVDAADDWYGGGVCK